MGRKSTFSALPDELSSRFHELLQSEKYTQAQIVEYLNDYLQDLGEQPVITRDIVQRQAKNYKERLAVAVERKRREREIISGYVDVFGREPNTDSVQLIALIIESAGARVALDMDEQDSPKISDIKNLAMTNKILIESKRVTDGIIEKAQKATAERVKAEMKAQGMDEETIKTVERVIVKANDSNS